MTRLLGTLVALTVALGLAVPTHSDTLPSGERILGNTTLEPGYDDMTGQIVYMITPNHVPVPLHANLKAQEDFFVVVYPTSSTVGTLNCMHKPVDNCPDHGPAVAAAAIQARPSVYSQGVLGHDHVFHTPGPPGGEFNANWVVKLVLFTSQKAANRHLTTRDQIMAAQQQGDVVILDTPISFLCAVVPAAIYQKAAPVEPVSGAP
jgi:hypothetical protein